MGWFAKKEKEEKKVEETKDDDSSEEEKTAAPIISDNVAITKLASDMDRIKASVESFGEVRKATTEQLSGLSSQIGELRAMIMDRDRSIQEIELKAVKASDLVETVQPEKLMVEIQKVNAKFEALKANLEGNEAIMNRIMDELKEARKKLEFFRGIEEIIKLSEEIKKELIEIKKVEASINLNADKAQTFYSEIRKKYQEIDTFNDTLQEVKASGDENSKDIDNLKNKITNLADKDELDKIVQKMQHYMTGLNELNKSSTLSHDLENLKKILQTIK